MSAETLVNSDKLRIVHVFRAPLGGLFRHVIDLAIEQASRGHEVGMFFDSGGMCERVEKQIARIPGGPKLGFKTFPISRNPSWGDVSAFMEFSRWLRELRPDVVHGHGSKGGMLSRFSAFSRVAEDPIRVYTPHGGSFNYRPGSMIHRIYMLAELIMAKRTDAFLSESDNVLGIYKKDVGAPIPVLKVVYNGLNESEFQPAIANSDAADILYVGELRSAKGIDTLLEAVPLIARARGETPRLVLVGSGPDRDQLIARAGELGLADHIVFAGPMPIREAFARGRIMVVPSRAESFPYVVLECAAARLPLVSTDVGGIPEIFGPYKDRLGPCDDPENLARRIVETLDMTSEAREARAAELADHVRKNFSVHDMATSVLAAYREAQALRGTKSIAAVSAAPSIS